MPESGFEKALKIQSYMNEATEAQKARVENIREIFEHTGLLIYETVVQAGTLKDRTAFVRRRWLKLADEFVYALIELANYGEDEKEEKA